MKSNFASLLASLGNRNLVLPHLENSIVGENWPDHYDVRVDSGPYYGAGDGYFHPSTHPMLSERQLYYMFHPDCRDLVVRERPSLQREMTLAMGSALHAVLQTQMKMCGLVSSDEDIEVEYTNDDHHVRGRIDWVVSHPDGNRYPVEMKSRNSGKYPLQTEPMESWKAQVNLALDSQDADLGVLIMVESGYPYRMREFHIRRDRELLDRIYGKFDRVRAAISANEPPRDCCGIAATDCPCHHLCWGR